MPRDHTDAHTRPIVHVCVKYRLVNMVNRQVGVGHVS